MAKEGKGSVPEIERILAMEQEVVLVDKRDLAFASSINMIDP